MKIDVFAHIRPPSYSKRVRAIVEHRHGDPLLKEWELMLAEDPALVDLDARWRSMDRFEDYRQVLVPGAPPIEALSEPAEVAELARELNDELADLVARFPERFVGFVAALPMSSVELAIPEMQRATAQLGALGVQVYSNVLGKRSTCPSSRASSSKRSGSEPSSGCTRTEASTGRITPMVARPSLATTSIGLLAGRTRPPSRWLGWSTRARWSATPR